MDTGNIHASLVLVGDRGVLIIGASGAGKSMLALELVHHAPGFSRLVADDRVIVEKSAGNRCVGSVPTTIAGLIEMRGIGIAARANESHAVIDLIAELVDDERIERMPEPQIRDGVAFIQVPRRDCVSARQHIAEALGRLNS